MPTDDTATAASKPMEIILAVKPFIDIVLFSDISNYLFHIIYLVLFRAAPHSFYHNLRQAEDDDR